MFPPWEELGLGVGSRCDVQTEILEELWGSVLSWNSAKLPKGS